MQHLSSVEVLETWSLLLPVPSCVLQTQNQELEELNKELRQCNLQQFIQQTGAMLTVSQPRSKAESQLDQTSHELPAHQRNGGQSAFKGGGDS